MRALALLVLTGCSTMTLRSGMVVTGGKPAFQASVEVGISFGSKRVYEFTHENGVQADEHGAAYVFAANADVITLDKENRPVARIGPRIRGVSNNGTTQSMSIGARGTFYTGILRDPKTRSGGLGLELAGGVGDRDGVIEASMVMSGRFADD